MLRLSCETYKLDDVDIFGDVDKQYWAKGLVRHLNLNSFIYMNEM